MSSREPTAFERVFSRKDLLRGTALHACLLFAAGSLLLCLALIDLFLIADLLVHQGTLRIAVAEREKLTALVGESLLAGEGMPPPHAVGGELVYSDRGILPTLWRDRERFWTPLLKAAYRGFSPLRNDAQALETLIVAAALLGWLRNMFESRARVRIMRKALEIAGRLRQSIHRQRLRLGPSDLEGHASAEALSLFTADVDRLREGVFFYADRMGRDPVQLALLLVLAIAINPRLAIVCLVPALACWLAVQWQTRRTEEARRLADAAAAHELRLLAESLDRTRLVRAFNMETFEQEQFAKSLERFQQVTGSSLQARAWSRRGVRTLIATCAALVLLFVGWSILPPRQEIPFAAGLFMIAAFIAAGFPLERLARLSVRREEAELSAHRIQSYLNRIPEVGQAVGARFLQPLSRMLALEDVSYETPSKRKLLDGLSVKIPAGRQVAIVATDPLEAEALACLLPRFIEPQNGRITIDGEDIAWVTLESLRAETILVGGKDPFLTATIRENISGGNPNVSLQEVTDAAKMARAHNFITRLPQGYETVIGQHGEQLDAGQAFRLGLARVALRKPALLIIEEPAEPLDDDTKTMLDDAYKRITSGRTVLYLARRLSTVKRADEILLLHQGRVAAIGPHSRLVQTSAMYRHWEYINFNEFRTEFETGA